MSILSWLQLYYLLRRCSSHFPNGSVSFYYNKSIDNYHTLYIVSIMCLYSQLTSILDLQHPQIVLKMMPKNKQSTIQYFVNTNFYSILSASNFDFIGWNLKKIGIMTISIGFYKIGLFCLFVLFCSCYNCNS